MHFFLNVTKISNRISASANTVRYNPYVSALNGSLLMMISVEIFPKSPRMIITTVTTSETVINLDIEASTSSTVGVVLRSVIFVTFSTTLNLNTFVAAIKLTFVVAEVLNKLAIVASGPSIRLTFVASVTSIRLKLVASVLVNKLTLGVLVLLLILTLIASILL